MAIIKMRVMSLDGGATPDTVGEALQLMKNSGNYPSYSTMRREILRENLPEMTYSFNWGGYKFNLVVEKWRRAKRSKSKVKGLYLNKKRS